MQRLSVLCLVFVGLLAAPAYLAAQQGGPPVAEVEVINEPLQVEVTNEPVEVIGAVEVTNEALEVTGSVEVSNLPQPSVPARFQLVGFTSATFTGGQGVLGFMQACQAEFPETRMCSSQEVIETTSTPIALTGTAWVRPSYQPSGAGLLDASGESAGLDPWRGNMACLGWTRSDSSGRGLTLDADGRFRANEACSQSHSVACCALVP